MAPSRVRVRAELNNEGEEESQFAMGDTPLPPRQKQSKRFTRRLPFFVIGLSVLVGLVIIAIGISYSSRPGPVIYYNWFTPIQLTACLLFETLQLYLVQKDKKCHSTSRVYRLSRWAYWSIVVLASFVSFVCLALRSLVPSTVTQLFAFVTGITGIWITWNQRHARTLRTAHSKWWIRILKVLNVFLKCIHAILCLLFVSGGIVLCLEYVYPSFGKSYQVLFTNGQSRKINTYCTIVPSLNSTKRPTIWLDADVSHGTTDFLGIQTYLADIHGRNSCSYDPPSFGWSDPALKDYTNTSQFFPSLITEMGLDKEPLIYVGWGGGSEESLMHALWRPNITAGVVMMDTSSDGIEWVDVARNKSWNHQQLLEYRQEDLASRISLTQIILALGMTWGLMPIFIPNDPSAYFNPRLYARHRAQAGKSYFWATQYYLILAMKAEPEISTFLTDTVLPTQIPLYGILSRNPNLEDEASNVFQRDQKVELLDHVAGGKDRVKGLKWCEGDCDLGFPVSRAQWTAEMLAEMLG